MSSFSVAAVPKILALLFLICLTRVAAGSCLSYGHSCWGGHGKRSTSLHHTYNPSSNDKRNDEWYFSKLLKILKEKPIESSALYNTRIRDLGTLDKLVPNGHLKHSLTESAEDTAARDQEIADLGNDTEREESENNEMDAETLFVPEEYDLIWNSKFHGMQKMADKARKTAG